MKDVDRILFVADGSPGQSPAFRRAIRFADAHRASLTLLRAPGAQQDPSQEGHDNGTSPASGAHVTTEVVEGPTTPEAVIERVLQQGQDLVIKAANTGSGILGKLFLNTDAELVRHSPCPVWIVKSPRKSTRPPRILAAVDPVSTKPGGHGLASRILDVAVSLAEDERGELHVVNAWDVPGEAMLRGRPIHVSEVQRLLRQIRAAHEKHLERLVGDFSYHKTTVHLMKGRIDKVIRRLIGQQGFDSIIVGVHCRDGRSPLMRGRMAEKILGCADCSVLAVKPTTQTGVRMPA